MNPNNDTAKLPESNLPIPVGHNLPVPVDSKPNLPVKVDMSPEDVGKALQLRHENRLTVKEPILTEDVIPLLGDGGQDPYKEPIRLNFDDEIEPGKRRMHSGASGRLIGRAVGAVIATAAMAAHQKVHEVENENSAVKGAHKAELITEHSVRSAARSYMLKLLYGIQDGSVHFSFDAEGNMKVDSGTEVAAESEDSHNEKVD